MTPLVNGAGSGLACGSNLFCSTLAGGGRAAAAALDASDAFEVAERAIVVADRLAAIIEHGGREITVVARIAILDRAAERSLIARRGQLFVVGQAGGVAIGGLAHAERPRLARH